MCSYWRYRPLWIWRIHAVLKSRIKNYHQGPYLYLMILLTTPYSDLFCWLLNLMIDHFIPFKSPLLNDLFIIDIFPQSFSSCWILCNSYHKYRSIFFELKKKVRDKFWRSIIISPITHHCEGYQIALQFVSFIWLLSQHFCKQPRLLVA